MENIKGNINTLLYSGGGFQHWDEKSIEEMLDVLYVDLQILIAVHKFN